MYTSRIGLIGDTFTDMKEYFYDYDGVLNKYFLNGNIYKYFNMTFLNKREIKCKKKSIILFYSYQKKLNKKLIKYSYILDCIMNHYDKMNIILGSFDLIKNKREVY